MREGGRVPKEPSPSILVGVENSTNRHISRQVERAGRISAKQAVCFVWSSKTKRTAQLTPYVLGRAQQDLRQNKINAGKAVALNLLF